jgi:hypothetical protein
LALSTQQEKRIMPQPLTRNPSVRDRLLHQASIDSDFRAELEADPESFGTSRDEFDLLPSVQSPDETFLEALAEGMAGIDVVACISSCSFGPVTWLCDGTTK